MNTNTIISLAILIAVSIFLFVLMNLLKSKKEKRKLKLIEDEAEKQNCLISKSEFCANLLIGIDETSNFLFFINKNRGKSQFVNLNDMRNCTLINKSRTLSNGGSSYKVIDKLGLNFVPKFGDNSEFFLEFYNSEYDSLNLSGELQLVEKWAEIVQNNIR
jgi:hypothetical protein